MSLSDLAVFLIAGLQGVAEVGRGHGQHVRPFEACEEANIHLRAVVEGERVAAEHGGAARMPRMAEHGQRRREEEERNAARQVKVHDLREDGEWRVVDYHAALRVLRVRVVAAREERAHDLRAVDAVAALGPRQDRLVHVRRRVSVVRGVARLELVDELVVLLHLTICPPVWYNSRRSSERMSPFAGLVRQRGAFYFSTCQPLMCPP